jgi:hypothetical protein
MPLAGGNRCRVTFQLTFLEANVAELADIVRLAIDLGVDRVKGHHLWAHFEAIESQSMRRDADAIRRWNQRPSPRPSPSPPSASSPTARGPPPGENIFLLDPEGGAA